MAATGGSVHTATNGQQAGAETQPSLDQVLAALKAIYDPRTTNQVRQDASNFLETAKRSPQAPAQGFQIASDTNNDATLRHFGLSMVEYYIKYVWDWDKDQEAEGMLRNYVLEFAKMLRPQDPAFIRNKVGQLWTELAKRSWGIEWLNMDEQLVELWNATTMHKMFVLNVLETLADEVFSRDDTVAGVRGGDLGEECTEIFMPEATLVELNSSIAKQASRLRCGDEGWLDRFCRLLKQALSSNSSGESEIHDLMTKTLSAILATIRWINLKAVAASDVSTALIQALVRGDTAVRTAAVEAMNVLYSRSPYDDGEFSSIVAPLFNTETVTLFRDAFQWAQVDPRDIDGPKYDFLKKLAETISHLGSWLEMKPSLIPQTADLPDLFALFLTVAQHPSMLVSIPLLHIWARILRSRNLKYQSLEYVRNNFAPLLQLCRQRLIRYESVPDEFEDDTVLFLQEDFDTMPERHAFVGSYRKYCVEVVECIVFTYPVDVIQLVVNESKAEIASQAQLSEGLRGNTYSKSSMPVILVDAHLTVVDAVVKGYHRWLELLEERDPQQNEDDFDKMQNIWQAWCESMMGLNLQDPEALRRIITEIVTISNKVLNLRPSFAMTVARYILSIDFPENSSNLQYTDAVKSCQFQCVLELQRLAFAWPNDLVKIFDELEEKINTIVAARKAIGRTSLGYGAFLFIIVQRAQGVNEELRAQRMERMLMPVKEAWEDPAVVQACSDFGSFCQYLGFTPMLEYLNSHQFYKVQDWSTQELDVEGQQIQAAIMQQSDNTPVRITKSLIQASFEKVKPGIPTFEVTRKLWTGLLPSMLPSLLKLNSYAQAFMNIEQWSALPEEMQQVIRRILQDRFWQAGISTETKDDFFARVSGSKQTYEGLASTVRGSVRQIRETGYGILAYLTRFEEDFYGIEGLPEVLSDGLFSNSYYLSSHHFNVLLNTARNLIEGCPVRLRRQFLTPFLSKLFSQIDRKLNHEWNIIYQLIAQAAAGQELGEEMKSESILRQLTYNSMMLLYSLLDLPRSHIDEELLKKSNGKDATHLDAKMDKFILSSPEILEPIFMLLNSGLRIRDTRSVTKVVDCIRILMPNFRQPGPAHDFISRDILQNAIMSFHEPFFVDSQRELCKLITEIIRFGGTIQAEIILSLTGLKMDKDKAKRLIEQIYAENRDKQARGLVWDLLSGIRGVSIHEMGKIELVVTKKKEKKDYTMNVEGVRDGARPATPPLENIGDMFGTMGIADFDDARIETYLMSPAGGH